MSQMDKTTDCEVSCSCETNRSKKRQYNTTASVKYPCDGDYSLVTKPPRNRNIFPTEETSNEKGEFRGREDKLTCKRRRRSKLDEEEKRQTKNAIYNDNKEDKRNVFVCNRPSSSSPSKNNCCSYGSPIYTIKPSNNSNKTNNKSENKTNIAVKKVTEESKTDSHLNFESFCQDVRRHEQLLQLKNPIPDVYLMGEDIKKCYYNIVKNGRYLTIPDISTNIKYLSYPFFELYVVIKLRICYGAGIENALSYIEEKSMYSSLFYIPDKTKLREIYNLCKAEL